MEAVLFCSFLSVWISLGRAYDNLALNKSAWQQHPFNNNDDVWGADRAVDGLYTDLSAAGGQCVVSGNARSTAEWRVDLGVVLSIHHIFIQYRTDNAVWDERNGYTGRFLGYSVYVSNSTNKEDGVLCFKDINYTKATIPNPTDITCITHGRYVIYYNNRTNPPYPDIYSPYAFSELCEVEVHGCPIPGYYGEDCSLPCPQNCQEGHCHIVDGTCLGCVPGYKGPTCNEKCLDQTYGLECQQICVNCKNKEPCHHVNGSCLNGCSSGFYGDSCNLECPDGWYGSNCQEQCNVNCGVQYRCDRVTGQCEGGCQVGWKGVKCDTHCNGGQFGQNCSSVCGHCLDKEQCHYIHGTCSNGCDDGYQGRDCTQVCINNTFGSKCSFICGNCLYRYGEQCHHETGQCPRGCDVGFHGDRCEQASSDAASTCQSSTAIYVSVTITVLSVLLNVFLIIRQLRNSLCTCSCLQQKIPDNVDKHFDGKNIELEKTTHFSKSKYDQAEDNAAYQELGEITKESPYNNLS
ncbi:scavenger receptor class F member 2 isoform X2 [Magallana gigas]|uniref:scavenger receptor class F member 2 isoform X1 n=1 Tax=Magallana gigas TaxID=29159 RepID=UPI00334295EF